MAKNSKDEAQSADKNVSTEILKMKRKMTLVIILLLVCILVLGGGMFFILSKDSAEASNEVVIENITALKDIPPTEAEKTYTRDIPSQTYMIPGGAIKFEGAMIFYNKECANLFNDITDLKTQKGTEPEFKDTDSLGDKIAKSAITLFLQENKKEDLKSTIFLAENLKNAINDAFVEKYGQEIIKEILITNHVVK